MGSDRSRTHRVDEEERRRRIIFAIFDSEFPKPTSLAGDYEITNFLMAQEFLFMLIYVSITKLVRRQGGQQGLR